MFGLMILLALLAIGALALGAGVYGWHRGRRRGASRLKAAGYAATGVLLVYLPFFYYQIPIYVTMQYRCAKDGGFTANKDPSQWRLEHQDYLMRIPPNEIGKSTLIEDGNEWRLYKQIGGLIVYAEKSSSVLKLGPGVGRTEQQWRDSSSGQVIARNITYGVGRRDDIRTWVVPRACPDQGASSDMRRRFSMTIEGRQ